MQLILTVDTEADNQWNVRAPLTTANLTRVPRLQRLCDEFGFAPTYLCTYEVATSDAFAETLTPHAADGRAEIGAHLHPWSTPPFDIDWDGVGTARPYPSELPVGLLARKLAMLTDTIARESGARPTSYRAGRWGFSTAQIPLLVELGYLIDCSVTPGVSWQRDTGLRVGGPDFTEAPATPYVLAEDDPCQAGASGLLEVPVTIVHTNSVMHRVAAARRWYRRHRRSLPARAANRMVASRAAVVPAVSRYVRRTPHRRVRDGAASGPAGRGNDVSLVRAPTWRVPIQPDGGGWRVSPGPVVGRWAPAAARMAGMAV